VVAAALDTLAAACSDVGGRSHTADAMQRADLNGDGCEDFVLYTGWIDCEGAASVYGDREKALMVFAGDERGGAEEVFVEWVYDANIEGTGAAATLWLTTSGEQCGGPPAPDFASETFCARAIVWNRAAKQFEYAPAAAARIIE
jgi:hypothetical protein